MRVLKLAGVVLAVCVLTTGCEAPDSLSDNAATNANQNTAQAPGNTSPFPPPKFVNVGLDNPDGLKIGPAVGQLVPEIEAHDLDGELFKLSDYRGQVIMLDFYGDW